MSEFKPETHGVLRMLDVASCKIVGEFPQKHPMEEVFPGVAVIRICY